MSALRALLAAMPDICRAMNEIDHRWQDRAFDALVNAALNDAHQQPAPSYSGTMTGYDPASTALMTPVRDGYDPLSSR